MREKFNIRLLLTQIGICAGLLLLSPLSVYIFTHNPEDAYLVFKILYPVLVPCFTVYFLNYYLFLPKLFFKGHKVWFYVANVAAIPVIKVEFVYELLFTKPPVELPSMAWMGIAAVIFANILAYAASAFVAWGMLNARRTGRLRQQLAEEKQRHTEAELIWLKNQINPHFLFNTLNNISSLMAIDTERAQECISRLSDLLRYAMYESDKSSVALGKEVEFMQNYISLMNLRCNDKTEVTSDFKVNSPFAPIAPLLLVSFIENAYKHGISTSRPSFIHMKLTESEGILSFVCDNSNFPKGSGDLSGNGIGLQNMRRRLELLYSGKYTWEQQIENGVYHVKIVVSLYKL